MSPPADLKQTNRDETRRLQWPRRGGGPNKEGGMKKKNQYLVQNHHTQIPDKVKGMVIAPYAYRFNRKCNFYHIDHVPTGLSMEWVKTRQQALQYIRVLNRLHLQVGSYQSAKKTGYSKLVYAIWNAVLSHRLIEPGTRVCSH